MRASSTDRSSLGSRRPVERPSRRGSTTVVCSTSTRVCWPSSVIVGRKVAGLALVVVGEVRETTVYGVDLVLHRTLRFPVGRGVIELVDEVENRGFSPAPVFILYHVNLGYPVVDATSRLIGPRAEVVGWDEVSREAGGDHARFAPPAAGFQVQVFEHRLSDPGATSVRIGIVNEAHEASGGIGVVVEYDPRQLPRLWQWRMLSEGIYVTGLEPANGSVLGRVAEREAGPVDELAPGERRRFGVTLQAATGGAVAELADPSGAVWMTPERGGTW